VEVVLVLSLILYVRESECKSMCEEACPSKRETEISQPKGIGTISCFNLEQEK
jgi:hypothetical protein